MKTPNSELDNNIDDVSDLLKTTIVVALLIGRGGSTLKDKNILPVLGHPLLHYTAAAARRSKYITRFYASSDCEKILTAATLAGYQPIKRPIELARPNSQSSDAVAHAYEGIVADGPADMIVVQHANVGTISTSIIDQCIETLSREKSASAVVPVHEEQECHPYRARTLDPEGYLRPFAGTPELTSGNRQDLPRCFFFDHSIWVIRCTRGISNQSKDGPWPCMGPRILPFVTTGCFDVHTDEDILATEKWISDNGAPLPSFLGR